MWNEERIKSLKTKVKEEMIKRVGDLVIVWICMDLSEVILTVSDQGRRKA